MNEVPQRCVLIVDDEPFIRSLMFRRLTRRGYRVLQSSNTSEAYYVVRAEKPDIMICDVLMPGEDGISFCKKLRAEGNRTPFLLMTVDDPSVEGTECLSKPIDLNDLEERLLAMLQEVPK